MQMHEVAWGENWREIPRVPGRFQPVRRFSVRGRPNLALSRHEAVEYGAIPEYWTAHYTRVGGHADALSEAEVKPADQGDTKSVPGTLRAADENLLATGNEGGVQACVAQSQTERREAACGRWSLGLLGGMWAWENAPLLATQQQTAICNLDPKRYCPVDEALMCSRLRHRNSTATESDSSWAKPEKVIGHTPHLPPSVKGGVWGTLPNLRMRSSVTLVSDD